MLLFIPQRSVCLVFGVSCIRIYESISFITGFILFSQVCSTEAVSIYFLQQENKRKKNFEMKINEKLFKLFHYTV